MKVQGFLSNRVACKIGALIHGVSHPVNLPDGCVGVLFLFNNREDAEADARGAGVEPVVYEDKGLKE